LTATSGRRILQSLTEEKEREGASLVTIQQLIDVLKANGWRETENEEGFRRLKQETLRKIITISGSLEMNVPPAVLRSIWRYAQLQE
jgi:predicted RNA binding protein YcfA (HicA-like mRNA interferase family)